MVTETLQRAHGVIAAFDVALVGQVAAVEVGVHLEVVRRFRPGGSNKAKLLRV